MHTTVTCFWLKSYCLLCMRSVVSSLSSSKAMSLLTERVRQAAFWNETPAFISSDLWSPSSTDLNSVGYKKYGDKCSSGSSKFMTSMNWSSAWSMSGMVLSKVSSMTQMTSGANVSASEFEFVWHEELLSIQFNSNNAYVVLHILVVNFMNIKQVLLC